MALLPEGAARAALQLVDDAGIPRDRLPADFDGPGLIEALERAKLRFQLKHAAQSAPATALQREAAGVIQRQALALALKLRDIAAEPVLRRAFLDAEGPAPFDELIRLLDRIAAADADAYLGGLAKAEPTTIPPASPAVAGVTARIELIGATLPAIYAKFFGRKFTYRVTEGADGLRHTEGVRFTRVSAAYIGIPVTADTVIAARKLWLSRGVPRSP